MKALVKLGYGVDWIMPFEDAVVLVRTLEHAEGYAKKYDNGGEQLYVTPNTVRIGLECITDEQYAVAKMRGEVPNI